MSKVGEALGVETETVKTWGMVRLKGRFRCGDDWLESVDYLPIDAVLHARFHQEPTAYGSILVAEVTLCMHGKTAEIHLDGEAAAELQKVLEALAKT